MTVDELYSLIEDIEQEQKCLFIVYDDNLPSVGVDILEWETEDCIDGGWFDSVEAAYKFCLEYQTEPVLRPLVAMSIESDLHGTFYHDPVLINSYQEAVEYELKIKDEDMNPYTEFLLFPKDTNLEEVIKEIKDHQDYSQDYQDYYDIEDVQKYFGVQEATYPDGTVAVLGDSVIVDSDDFSWGVLKKQQFTGTITLLDDPRYIQLKLDGFERELRLPHYLVKKHE
ncbi:hypothetical protein XbC2_165 [Xanthomonas phage XbC2]|nr:hypothetical protein XbC2_165 [Xanthomonas phage XbC2]